MNESDLGMHAAQAPPPDATRPAQPRPAPPSPAFRHLVAQDLPLPLSHPSNPAPLLDSREICDLPRKTRPLCRGGQWARATVAPVGF